MSPSLAPERAVRRVLPVARRKARQLGIAMFNVVGTTIPSHHVRLTWLRLVGATIQPGASIGRGTIVLDAPNLYVGRDCAIGRTCVLDARGGIYIDDCVTIASDTHIITAQHIVDSDDFAAVTGPAWIGDHVWIASRATIVMGVTIGRGAVVGACSLVRSDVAPLEVVAGVPARPRGIRRSSLEYNPRFRPLFE